MLFVVVEKKRKKRESKIRIKQNEKQLGEAHKLFVTYTVTRLLHIGAATIPY